MLKAEDIRDDNYRRIALELLQKHAKELPSLVNDEVNRWREDFVSDDGTDYVKAALHITEALVGLVYEGSAADLRFWLFAKPTDENPNKGSVAFYPLSVEACDGISSELVPYYDLATEE